MTGIEIGPWFKPTVPKRVWDAIVIDFADTRTLRRIARTHNDKNMRAAAAMIEPVDVVWRGQPLDEACLALRPEGFDFLIASHVFEHLPDLIRVLKEVGRLLKPYGVINLALPDMRFTFDFFRPVTTLADVLRAHREQHIRHTPETVFSAELSNTWSNGLAMWSRDAMVVPHIVSLLEPAYDIYVRETDAMAEPNRPYVDAHAWVFTPSVFELLILELHHLDLIPFQVVHIEDGELGEFIVQLAKSAASPSSNEVHARRRELMIAIVLEQAERAERMKRALTAAA